MLQPPPRPQKGQPIPHDWFGDFYDYVRTLQVRGDLETTQVSRDRSGTVVRAPKKSGARTPAGKTSALIAKITTNNNDGTYEGEAQKNTSGTFANRDAGTYTFDATSAGSGYLYELNGKAGVSVGTFVVVHRVPDAGGGWIWYFDATSDVYGFSDYGGGAWAEITGESAGDYSWKQKDADASTDTTPAVTGTTNASEVDGRTGIKTGSIVWLRYDGTNYHFTYHGDPSGTLDTLTEGTLGSPSADAWDRANQGATYGVSLNLQSDTRIDPSTGEIYKIRRNHQAKANGHEEIWSGETETLIGVGTPSTQTYPYKNCDTNAVVARFDFADLPTQDYAWIHDGANFVDCYKDSISVGAATSPVPCIVYKDGSAATQCSDLTIADFSDDFDDNSLDTCKWDSTVTNSGSFSETGGKAQFTTASSGTDEDVYINQTSFPDIGSADFEFSVDMVVSSWDTSTSNVAGAWLNVQIAGASYDIFKAYINGTSDYRFRGRINGTFQTDVVSNSTSTFSLRVRRASGTVYLDYDNGGGWTNFASGSQSATPTEVFIGALHNQPGASMTVTADNFTVS